MPQVIISTDMYLDKGYRLPSMIIPMTILAMREPWRERIKLILECQESIKSLTYRPENHVQWHGDVKVKGVVITNADSEEHQDQEEVIPESDPGSLSSHFVCENEAF